MSKRYLQFKRIPICNTLLDYGLSEFTDAPIFESSLFVSTRKRLGTDDFNEMSLLLMQLSSEYNDQSSDSEDAAGNSSSLNDTQISDPDKIDATCADAEERYPTDIDLLYDGCRVLNRYINKLCKSSKLPMSRTFESCARTFNLNVIRVC